MRDLHAFLRAHIAALVKEWDRHARTVPALASLSDEQRIDHLPELLGILLSAALGNGADPAIYRQVVYAGADHGEQRHRLGVPEATLFSEHGVLRARLWAVIERWSDAAPDSAVLAIMKLDIALGFATQGALRGYHRATLESVGRWPYQVEKAVREYEQIARRMRVLSEP